jgi:glycopeptide antibiotics resistance protein
MILFVIYLISLVWMVVFLTYFVRPFKQKSELQKNKIKYIPLKKATHPNTKYYILKSGEIIEIVK